MASCVVSSTWKRSGPASSSSARLRLFGFGLLSNRCLTAGAASRVPARSPNGSDEFTGSPFVYPYALSPPASPMGSSWVNHPDRRAHALVCQRTWAERRPTLTGPGPVTCPNAKPPCMPGCYRSQVSEEGVQRPPLSRQRSWRTQRPKARPANVTMVTAIKNATHARTRRSLVFIGKVLNTLGRAHAAGSVAPSQCTSHSGHWFPPRAQTDLRPDLRPRLRADRP